MAYKKQTLIWIIANFYMYCNKKAHVIHARIAIKKAHVINMRFFCNWCRKRDLNPHSLNNRLQDPQSCVSANSTIPAMNCSLYYSKISEKSKKKIIFSSRILI